MKFNPLRYAQAARSLLFPRLPLATAPQVTPGAWREGWALLGFSRCRSQGATAVSSGVTSSVSYFTLHVRFGLGLFYLAIIPVLESLFTFHTTHQLTVSPLFLDNQAPNCPPHKWSCDPIRGPHPLVTGIINLRNELGPQAGPVQLSLGLFSLELIHWKEVNLELQTMVSLPWWRSCLQRMRQASLGGRNESERDSLDGIKIPTSGNT